MMMTCENSKDLHKWKNITKVKLVSLRVLDQDGEYKSRLVLKVRKKRYSKSRN